MLFPAAGWRADCILGDGCVRVLGGLKVSTPVLVECLVALVIQLFDVGRALADAHATIVSEKPFSGTTGFWRKTVSVGSSVQDLVAAHS